MNKNFEVDFEFYYNLIKNFFQFFQVIIISYSRKNIFFFVLSEYRDYIEIEV